MSKAGYLLHKGKAYSFVDDKIVVYDTSDCINGEVVTTNQRTIRIVKAPPKAPKIRLNLIKRAVKMVIARRKK